MAINIASRKFIAALGGGAVWPRAARAQQADRMRRVGVLWNLAADDPEGKARLAAFLQGLQELGWTDGRNVRIDYRWAAGDADLSHIRGGIGRIRARRHPGLYQPERGSVATNNPYRTADRVRDCHRSGRGRLRRELSAPGRQRHWVYAVRIQPKRKMARSAQRDCAQLARIAVLRDPAIASGIGQFAAIQAMAPPSFRVELNPIDVRDAGEIVRDVAAFARESNGGLIVTGSAWAVALSN